jgi:hypothetical protein
MSGLHHHRYRMSRLRLHLLSSAWSGWADSGRRKDTTIVGSPDTTIDRPTRVQPGLIHTTTTIEKGGDTTKGIGAMKIMITAMKIMITAMGMVTTSHL